ncbi:sugar transferase [uncultured Campylobacter sp.]|uniref:sugar transferase n=1 Tax=uncultured Campylobacter sp. TaxID=218934 RepID=UPI0026086989|nr:sugar transferase [uncultured Campylobacter sp.]
MKKQLCILIILAVDIFGIWLCFGLAVVLKNLLYGDSVLLDIGRYQGFAPSYVIMIFLFFYQGIYSRRYDFWHESRILVRSCFFGLLLSLALLALIKVNYEFSRASFILSFAFMAVVLPIFKLITKRELFKFGLWQKRAKILGEGEEFESAVLESAYLGYVRALGSDYDVLFIGGSRLGAKALNELIEHNIRKNKEILFTPVLRSYDFTQADIYSVFASRTSLFAIRNSLKSPLNLALKRGLDLALIFLALPLLVPIFGVIALMMKLKEPKGRIFFSHQRMGFGGKPFGCLKFRSMKENGDEILAQYLKQNPQEVEYFEKYHKYEHDPRITKLGDFLRKSSLDELPQLINVLKGEMSIVGPRPCAQYERKDMGEYADLILAVKPGITGLWQVSGRSDVDFATRAGMDAWYMKNWSIWNDIVIIIKTFKVVLVREGAI